jgi:tetratricopeptide (TPR) repeat protein
MTASHPNPSLDVGSIRERIRYHIDQEAWGAALQTALLLIEHSPQDATSVAALYGLMEMPDKVAEIIEWVGSRWPDDYGNRLWYCFYLLENSHFAKSFELLESFAPTNEAENAYFMIRAKIYCSARDILLATESSDRAIQAARNRDELVNALRMYASILRAFDLNERAIEMYLKVLEVQPDDYDSINNITALLYKQAQYADLLAFCTDTRQILGDIPNIVRLLTESLVYAWLAMQEYKPAQNEFDFLKKEFPDCGSIKHIEQCLYVLSFHQKSSIESLNKLLN